MHRVLILSREAAWGGGVVNFVEMLKQNLSADFSVKLLRIGQRRGLFGRVARGIMPFVDALRLMAVLCTSHYDIVMINPSFNSHSLLRDGLFVMTARACRTKNVVVFFHGWQEETEDFVRNSRLARALFMRSFGKARCVFVLAHSFKEALCRIGVDRGRIMTATTMFEGRDFHGTGRKNTSAGKKVVFLGRFVPEKGIYELLEAFRVVKDKFPSVHLVLAGDGPEGGKLRQRVQDSGLEPYVEFSGYVRGSEKARVLMESDVFVLPSYHEACPVALLEAMAAGLPVIATRVGAIPDILEDEKNGILLDTASPVAIAAAVSHMLSNDMLREEIGQRNKNIAWKKYEASVVSREIAAVWQKLLMDK
jgi:glycosyltransferase involved in cell wall biosynthesis